MNHHYRFSCRRTYFFISLVRGSRKGKSDSPRFLNAIDRLNPIIRSPNGSGCQFIGLVTSHCTGWSNGRCSVSITPQHNTLSSGKVNKATANRLECCCPFFLIRFTTTADPNITTRPFLSYPSPFSSPANEPVGDPWWMMAHILSVFVLAVFVFWADGFRTCRGSFNVLRNEG